MNYSERSLENYTIEDFIADESFINYHLQLDDKDKIFWEEWLLKNPAKKVIAKDAALMIGNLSFTLDEKEYACELNKIKKSIAAKTPEKLFSILTPAKLYQSEKPKKRMLQYMLGCFLILAAGAAFLLTQRSENKILQLAATINRSNKPLVFMLADSTIVTLAPNSTLQYPSSFKGENRQVYLQGEAGFNVKRNEHFPFKVQAKKIVTTVLGTIFNIKNPGDSAIVVELFKGKLKVEIADSAAALPIMLYPGEKAVYVFKDKQFYKNYSTAADTRFVQNSFEEIALRIKNVFGKTVINNSNKQHWNFTGNFKNASAKDIIENICLIKNLQCTLVGDTIFINQK